MAQTEEATVSFRGRRPGLTTLDSRLDEVESAVKKSRISNKRLAEMHEATQLLQYHYAGHAENGEKVNGQVERVENVLKVLAEKIQLPAENGTAQAEQPPVDVLTTVRKIRESRQSLLESLQALQMEEEALYPEIGRKMVEEALGQPA